MSSRPKSPSPLAPRFAGALTGRCGVRPGHKLVAAVSGGADSLCLLHLLVDFRRRHGYPELHVAHLDHAVRGAAGRRDASSVRRLSRAQGLPCTVESLPPWGAAPSEEALRRARHAFLERVRGSCGADWIALAHHRHDQAETVLWNLARGSGRRGLGAMRHLSGRLIRPLLDFAPEELRAFLKARRVRWSEDASNRSAAYTRNRVRALIPLLERRVHPASERNLARAARILGAEDELLDSLAARRLSRLVVHAGGFMALETSRLRPEHPAMLQRILRLAVRRLSRGALSLSLARTERLAALALSGGGRLDLGGGVRAERRGALLLLGPAELVAPGRRRLPLPEALSRGLT